jgi:hypothetical protein
MGVGGMCVLKSGGSDLMGLRASLVVCMCMCVYVAGLCQFFQPWLFAIAGEKLTTRLRYESFASLMRQVG